MTEYPKIIKGTLTTIRNIESEKPVISARIREIPVAPPSIKAFGSKNPFKPIVAHITPNKMSPLSLSK